MSEWKEVISGDVLDLISGYAFKSKDFKEFSREDHLPVIKIKNVANGDVNFDNVVYHEVTEKLEKYILERGDVLIAMTGNHPHAMTQVVGDVSRYKLYDRALLNQRVGKLIVKDDNRLDFFYYYFKDEDNRNYLANQSSGSANQANISKGVILGLPMLIPEPKEQRAIASVLSCLDDKIDLLHRQNQTLEQIAETLFREWFIEEADEGWDATTLYDAIELVGGGTPKTSIEKYWNGDIKWLSGGDIASNHKSIITESEKTITVDGLNNSSAKLLPKFSTVISARGTVGKYCILSEPMACSQSNYGIKPKYQDCYFFTYLLINHSVEELNSAAYGSVFDTITTNTFKGLEIALPSEKEIKAFEAKVENYFFKILNNQTHIRTLTALRDALLPKLMSGEVRVVS